MHHDAMTTNDEATEWQSHRLDLDAYLSHIGYDGELAPTLDVLRAITRAHVTSIPFEVVEIVLGRTISLELTDIQDKIVYRNRGGYCYEHTLLFAAALERIGFGVTGLASRVRIGTDIRRPATHALLRVETAETAETGKVYLSDPGFGRHPLEPMELTDGSESTAGGWGFRLRQEATGTGAPLYVMQTRGADGWFDLHGFTLDQRYPQDYMVSSHYLSTHTRSPFWGRLVVQHMREDCHYFLDGSVLTKTLPDGTTTARTYSPDEIPALLQDLFGVELAHTDHDELDARVNAARQAVAQYPATVNLTTREQTVQPLWSRGAGHHRAARNKPRTSLV